MAEGLPIQPCLRGLPKAPKLLWCGCYLHLHFTPGETEAQEANEELGHDVKSSDARLGPEGSRHRDLPSPQ